MRKRRISNYFNDEIQAILNKYRQIDNLIPKQAINIDGSQSQGSDHTAEEGRFIESIIRNMLNKYLPSNLRALSGFILRPEALIGENDNQRIKDNAGNQHSKQLDVIVYDIGNYPLYEQFEEFAIVPPEGVVGIISVKKTLYKKDIKHELDALLDAASLCRHYIRKDGTNLNSKDSFEKVDVIAPFTALLGFTSSFGNRKTEVIAKEIFDDYIEEQKKYPYDAIIKLITVLDQFSILKTEENISNIKKDGVETTFVRFKHFYDDEEYFDVGIQLVLQSILKTYYHRTRSPFIVKPGFDKIDDAFKVKDRLGHFVSCGYRINEELKTSISLKRNSIRQKLINKK